ncbi:hypothetical protein K438DRAFT_1780799 [Mycena galopus ATCC 62051]|nr:hypothetical protein K438DRAFT_1780799 [Mycena galopus ATCC 62051]
MFRNLFSAALLAVFVLGQGAVAAPQTRPITLGYEYIHEDSLDFRGGASIQKPGGFESTPSIAISSTTTGIHRPQKLNRRWSGIQDGPWCLYTSKRIRVPRKGGLAVTFLPKFAVKYAPAGDQGKPTNTLQRWLLQPRHHNQSIPWVRKPYKSTHLIQKQFVWTLELITTAWNENFCEQTSLSDYGHTQKGKKLKTHFQLEIWPEVLQKVPYWWTLMKTSFLDA